MAVLREDGEEAIKYNNLSKIPLLNQGQETLTMYDKYGTKQTVPNNISDASYWFVHYNWRFNPPAGTISDISYEDTETIEYSQVIIKIKELLESMEGKTLRSGQLSPVVNLKDSNGSYNSTQDQNFLSAVDMFLNQAFLTTPYEMIRQAGENNRTTISVEDKNRVLLYWLLMEKKGGNFEELPMPKWWYKKRNGCIKILKIWWLS